MSTNDKAIWLFGGVLALLILATISGALLAARAPVGERSRDGG